MTSFSPSLQIENHNVKIWRYLDLPKFISILQSQSLFFPRADKLNDPFEGTYPKQFIQKEKQQIEEHNKNSKYKLVPITAIPGLKKRFAISCWHMNNHESMAMWEIYLKSNVGVAIQTTCKKLSQSFIDKENITIRRVNYIDYNIDNFEQNDVKSNLFHKRKYLEHEHEIRAIIDKFYTFRDIKGSGIYIKVDVRKLIENVYAPPSCEKWVLNSIQQLIKKYNYNFRVKKSSLDKEPFTYSC